MCFWFSFVLASIILLSLVLTSNILFSFSLVLFSNVLLGKIFYFVLICVWADFCKWYSRIDKYFVFHC